MKMERDELSLGSEFTAAMTVLNSPDAVDTARTTIAPEGGEMSEAARAAWQIERMTIGNHAEKSILFVDIVC